MGPQRGRPAAQDRQTALPEQVREAPGSENMGSQLGRRVGASQADRRELLGQKHTGGGVVDPGKKSGFEQAASGPKSLKALFTDQMLAGHGGGTNPADGVHASGSFARRVEDQTGVRIHAGTHPAVAARPGAKAVAIGEEAHVPKATLERADAGDPEAQATVLGEAKHGMQPKARSDAPETLPKAQAATHLSEQEAHGATTRSDIKEFNRTGELEVTEPTAARAAKAQFDEDDADTAICDPDQEEAPADLGVTTPVDDGQEALIRSDIELDKDEAIGAFDEVVDQLELDLLDQNNNLLRRNPSFITALGNEGAGVLGTFVSAGFALYAPEGAVLAYAWKAFQASMVAKARGDVTNVATGLDNLLQNRQPVDDQKAIKDSMIAIKASNRTGVYAGVRAVYDAHDVDQLKALRDTMSGIKAAPAKFKEQARTGGSMAYLLAAAKAVTKLDPNSQRGVMSENYKFGIGVASVSDTKPTQVTTPQGLDEETRAALKEAQGVLWNAYIYFQDNGGIFGMDVSSLNKKPTLRLSTEEVQNIGTIQFFDPGHNTNPLVKEMLGEDEHRQWQEALLAHNNEIYELNNPPDGQRKPGQPQVSYQNINNDSGSTLEDIESRAYMAFAHRLLDRYGTLSDLEKDGVPVV